MNAERSRGVSGQCERFSTPKGGRLAAHEHDEEADGAKQHRRCLDIIVAINSIYNQWLTISIFWQNEAKMFNLFKGRLQVAHLFVGDPSSWDADGK